VGIGVEAGVEEGAPVGDAVVGGGRIGERVPGEAEMAAGARPGPVLGPIDEAGADRIGGVPGTQYSIRHRQCACHKPDRFHAKS
jgi:hypothetical protein